MKIGYVHDEFGYSWSMKEAQPYNHPKAFFSDTQHIHGTIHHIPPATKGDKLPFRPDFDYSPYDVLIFYLQGGRCITDVQYMREIKKKYPDVLLIWWWGEIYRQDQDPELWWEHVLKQERELVKIVDVMSSPFHMYESVMAPIYMDRFNTPYRTIHEPYDTEHIKRLHNKTTMDIENGVWTMIHGRYIDIRRSLTAMGRLQKRHPPLNCYIHTYHSEHIKTDYLPKWLKEVAPLLRWNETKVIPNHCEFLDYLKTLYFIFDDYPAICSSNLSVNAACVGLPTISNDWNTSNTLCFPELTFGFDDVDAWVEAGDRLIYDHVFYKNVMRTAQRMVEEYYSYRAVNERIINIWKEFRCC